MAVCFEKKFLFDPKGNFKNVKIEAKNGDLGVLNNICKFLELVSHDIFPLYNIYFLLFLDTVNLFATEDASGLRYRKKTMLFWMFGLLYFHGKWIRFCRDEKFSGKVLEHKESKKYFNPQLFKPRINFAAPSDKIQKTV